MNKKDVLGARPAAWIIQKMKSAPNGLSAGNAQNTALDRAWNGGKFWLHLVSDPCIQPGIECLITNKNVRYKTKCYVD